MMKLDEVRRQVSGILALVACGGSHEIEDDRELATFEAEIDEQPDGSLILTCDEGTQRFRLTIDLAD